MAKKKKKIRVGTISQKDVLKGMKERQQRNQSGAGVHGDTKFNRNKQKQNDRKIINGNDE